MNRTTAFSCMRSISLPGLRKGRLGGVPINWRIDGKTITLDLTLVPSVLLCVIKCPFYRPPSARLHFSSLPRSCLVQEVVEWGVERLHMGYCIFFWNPGP